MFNWGFLSCVHVPPDTAMADPTRCRPSTTQQATDDKPDAIDPEALNAMGLTAAKEEGLTAAKDVKVFTITEEPSANRKVTDLEPAAMYAVTKWTAPESKVGGLVGWAPLACLLACMLSVTRSQRHATNRFSINQPHHVHIRTPGPGSRTAPTSTWAAWATSLTLAAPTT